MKQIQQIIRQMINISEAEMTQFLNDTFCFVASGFGAWADMKMNMSLTPQQIGMTQHQNQA
jgi:hypothetical protein